MYPPGQDQTILDGQINLPVAIQTMPLVVGTCEGGTADTLYAFYDTPTLIATLKRGPAVEMAAPVVASGGCLVLKTAGSTAGTAGAVSVTRAGTSTGTVTVAGTPNDAYRVRVAPTKSGTLGAGRFKYALDGDSNTTADGWGPEYTIPTGGTFVLPETGLTLTFVPGAGATFFDVGDVHRFDCVAPMYTTADLTAAFAKLLEQLGSVHVRKIGFAGFSQTASAAVTLAAFIGGLLDDFAAKMRPARAILDGGSIDTLANFKTAIASFTDDRIGLVYDPVTATTGCKIASKVPFTGWAAPVVPFANAVFERYARTLLSESCARVKSGALRGVKRIGNNEAMNPQFTAADRIITARRVDGYDGFFVTKPWIRSAPTSTFRTLQWGSVIDELCEVSYTNLQQWLETDLDAVTDGTGRLSEASAALVESGVNIALNVALKEPKGAEGRSGHVSDCSYVVTRNNDFLATGEIYGFAAAVPTREVEGIHTTIALVASLNTGA